MTKKIVTLAGDGIGPEIMSAGLRVLKAVSKKIAFEYELEAKDFGGIAIDKHGHPLPEETLQAVKNADAILLAAIGHPKYNDAKVRPEQGLLALRKELGLYANVRPLKIYPALKNLSPIRNVENVDFVVIRELTGGIYFGQHELSDEKARDINDYTADEIRRILHFAFKIAQNRPRKLLTSVDKQNVLATSKLWRKIADEIAVEYPDVTLEHQLVDSCAMLLITEPQKFDVIVTENLFGDILSDEASSLAGTLGVMPSSSHGFNGLSLYEPIHGSAPDIAGKGIANPVSMILSVAMMLRESFGQEEGATLIEKAVTQTFADGTLTQDLGGNATTAEMTEAILKNCQ
ncbi:3-isopropylmalate dehydrogenase [Lactococcus cremoris]|uniref:3-isopropylmalate dehydrogenase n=1 Tax=Lactococcus lactis subsp. cremoris TaxID=1359 RepID=UPI0003AB89B6|nr:3-isopropylmalate dehydrogenase [Lactococcus cremoris]AGV73138.1 3-isopropylmalate dehydrogenase LeuB [Lactococcus cremoris subsp. cremoris KW2]